jgi:3-oxoacyl-[acyl-carrier-protein] synthase-3
MVWDSVDIMGSSADTAQAVEDENSNWRSADNLFMDGLQIFDFTMRAAPGLVRDLLERSGKRPEDVDLFVFH